MGEKRKEVSQRGRLEARRLWVGVPCVLATVAVAVVFASVHSRLPDRLAIQWDAAGQPTNFAQPGVMLGLTSVAMLSMGAGFVRSAVRASVASRTVWAGSCAGAVFLGYLFTAMLVANARAAAPDEVDFPLWHLAIGAAAAAVAAFLGRLLPGWSRRAAGGSKPQSLGLKAGEHAVWVRTVGPVWLVWIGAAACVGAVLAGLFWLIPAGALTALLAGVRVRVSEAGVEIGLPVVARPRLRMPLERIEEAVSGPVRPWSDLGGWGYRRVGRRSGLALRAGEGLWLTLAGGREFVVVVKDAVTAAALVNDLMTHPTRRAGHADQD